MVITDNVLTQYVNGPDGVLAGVSIYDAMMSFVTDTLPKYKNDPVIVTAMREACHHNLYAIANSCGMNGVGADTTIKGQGAGSGLACSRTLPASPWRCSLSLPCCGCWAARSSARPKNTRPTRISKNP